MGSPVCFSVREQWHVLHRRCDVHTADLQQSVQASHTAEHQSGVTPEWHRLLSHDEDDFEQMKHGWVSEERKVLGLIYSCEAAPGCKVDGKH